MMRPCLIPHGEGDGKGDDLSRSASLREDVGVGHRLGTAITARLGFGTVIQELAYLMRAGEPDALRLRSGRPTGQIARNAASCGALP